MDRSVGELSGSGSVWWHFTLSIVVSFHCFMALSIILWGFYLMSEHYSFVYIWSSSSIDINPENTHDALLCCLIQICHFLYCVLSIQLTSSLISYNTSEVLKAYSCAYLQLLRHTWSIIALVMGVVKTFSVGNLILDVYLASMCIWLICFQIETMPAYNNCPTLPYANTAYSPASDLLHLETVRLISISGQDTKSLGKPSRDTGYESCLDAMKVYTNFPEEITKTYPSGSISLFTHGSNKLNPT